MAWRHYINLVYTTAFSFWILKKNLSQKRNWELMEALIGCSSEASRMGGISEIKTSCFWSGWSEINFRHIPPFSIWGGPKTLMGDQRAGWLKNLVSKRAEGSEVPRGHCMYIFMFNIFRFCLTLLPHIFFGPSMNLTYLDSYRDIPTTIPSFGS